jgi:hypothetical protein
MNAILIAGVIALLGWLAFRSISRDKARRDLAVAIKARVRQAHGLQDVFVSREDDSFVGLSGDGATVVLGRGDEEQAVPVAAIRSVEGLRDGMVLIRAEPDSNPVAPPTEQSVADVPRRIQSLALRVTVEDQPFTVLFFDGGRHGADPVNEQFRKSAARTEAWFRKLSTAMRLARA